MRKKGVSNAVYGPVCMKLFVSHAPGIQLKYELLRKSIEWGSVKSMATVLVDRASAI